MKSILIWVATGVTALFLTACGETPPTQQAEAQQAEMSPVTTQPAEAPQQTPDAAQQSDDTTTHETTPAEAAGATTEE